MSHEVSTGSGSDRVTALAIKSTRSLPLPVLTPSLDNSQTFGNKIGKAISAVNMQRAL